jgi:hypothetical protein
MSDYTLHLDELVLEVPKGFQDRSVQVLEWPIPGGERIALVIQREPLAEEDAFEGYVARTTADYPKSLASYHAEDPQTFDLPIPYVSKPCRWRHEDSVLYQHQVFLRLYDRSILVTASARAAHRDDVDELLRRCLAEPRIRER